MDEYCRTLHRLQGRGRYASGSPRPSTRHRYGQRAYLSRRHDPVLSPVPRHSVSSGDEMARWSVQSPDPPHPVEVSSGFQDGHRTPTPEEGHPTPDPCRSGPTTGRRNKTHTHLTTDRSPFPHYLPPPLVSRGHPDYTTVVSPPTSPHLYTQSSKPRVWYEGNPESQGPTLSSVFLRRKGRSGCHDHPSSPHPSYPCLVGTNPSTFESRTQDTEGGTSMSPVST